MSWYVEYPDFFKYDELSQTDAKILISFMGRKSFHEKVQSALKAKGFHAETTHRFKYQGVDSVRITNGHGADGQYYFGDLYEVCMTSPHDYKSLADVETALEQCVGSGVSNMTFFILVNAFIYNLLRYAPPNMLASKAFAIYGTAQRLEVSYVRIQGIEGWYALFPYRSWGPKAYSKNTHYRIALKFLQYRPFAYTEDDTALTVVRGYVNLWAASPMFKGIPLPGCILHRLMNKRSVLHGQSDVIGQYHHRTSFLRMYYPRFITNVKDLLGTGDAGGVAGGDDFGPDTPLHFAITRINSYANNIQAPLVFGFSWTRTAHALYGSTTPSVIELSNSNEWFPYDISFSKVSLKRVAVNVKPRQGWATAAFLAVRNQMMRRQAMLRNEDLIVGSALMGVTDYYYSDFLMHVGRRCKQLKDFAVGADGVGSYSFLNAVYALMDNLMSVACQILQRSDDALPDNLPDSVWLPEHRIGETESMQRNLLAALLVPNSSFDMYKPLKDTKSARTVAFEILSDPLQFILTNGAKYVPLEDLQDVVYFMPPNMREDVLYSWLYGDHAQLFASRLPGLHPNCAMSNPASLSRGVCEAIVSTTKYAMYATGRASAAQMLSTKEVISVALGAVGSNASIVDETRVSNDIYKRISITVPYYGNPRKKHEVSLYAVELCLMATRLVDPHERYRNSWGKRWLDSKITTVYV